MFIFSYSVVARTWVWLTFNACGGRPMEVVFIVLVFQRCISTYCANQLRGTLLANSLYSGVQRLCAFAGLPSFLWGPSLA